MKFNTRLITPCAATMILCCASLLSAAKKPAPTSFEALVVKVNGSSVVLDAVEEKHFKRTTVQTDSTTQVILNLSAFIGVHPRFILSGR